jgi:hypothetical protein
MTGSVAKSKMEYSSLINWDELMLIIQPDPFKPKKQDNRDQQLRLRGTCTKLQSRQATVLIGRIGPKVAAFVAVIGAVLSLMYLNSQAILAAAAGSRALLVTVMPGSGTARAEIPAASHEPIAKKRSRNPRKHKSI